MSALRTGDPHALAPQLTNDLQAAAVSLRPELGELLSSGMEFGALGGIVSGSGPTCVFLAADAADAERIAAGLRAAGVCRAVRTAYGPVPGARAGLGAG